MALKPRTKRRIMWGAICVVAAFLLAFILVPPMLNLNSLKPKLESAILRQTGIAAKINGDVHFSLLYRATVVAHNITIPTGAVRSVMFSVPLYDVFNLADAPMDGHITVDGARIVADSLAPYDFRHSVDVTNSTVSFLGKDYDVVRGTVSAGRFSGTVRTNQHKYDIDFENDEFRIRNRTNNLNIQGQLYADGTARGELSIKTDDVNRWFDFSEPKINRPIDMTMNFDWDGGYGFDFTNIRGNGFSGNIRLYPDGARDIKLNATDLDYDFSFLLHPMGLFKNTSIDLNLYGNLRVGDMRLGHLRVSATGTDDIVQIGTVIADNVSVVGGYIDADGAHNIMVSMPLDGVPSSCVFSGTSQNWRCDNFNWGNMSGTISVTGDTFTVSLTSPDKMPTVEALRVNARRLARRGTVDFVFADAAGRLVIDDEKISPEFRFAKNKTLTWAGINMPFLPKFITMAHGEFTRADNITRFRPDDGGWEFAVTDKGAFVISGDNFKRWVDNVDLRALAGFPYSLSGVYAGGVISDIEIQVGGHVFRGRYVDGTLTLETDTLNMDVFANQDFIDNYAEQEFLAAHPLVLPFGLGINIALSADSVIFNGDEYKNFVYVLKRGTQTFSITDDARGNLLATIMRKGAQYQIEVSVAGFKIVGGVLGAQMPLNVSDTRITGEIDMTTFGRIAHDIEYNMTGTVDLMFDGGYIDGIGLDDFYASVGDITKLNAEYALAAAFDGGQTMLKKMTLVGKYENGVFNTTAPMTISMPHVDAAGQIQIADGTMAARLRLVMRGTSPDPQPIDVEIGGNGVRNYSLSQIMRDFDPGYLRSFVKTHSRF